MHTPQGETERRRHRRSLPIPFSNVGSGIYGIINTSNHKIYVGSGMRLKHRWSEHRSCLEQGTHHSRYLQRAFNKEPDAFQIEVIEELHQPSKQVLLSREQFWMDFYQSYMPARGYNVSPKSDSCQGIKRDEELKNRISATLKGRKMSPERLATHKRAMAGHKGRRFTAEQKAEQSRKFKGRKMPAGWGDKISRMFLENPPTSSPVLQFSLDGKFIRRFKTITEAERAYGGRTNIHSACKGKRRQALGFVWRYAHEATEHHIIPIRPIYPKRYKHKHGQREFIL